MRGLVEKFKVAKYLVDPKLVKDIYQNIDLTDMEITNILVELRKKNAIKVLGRINE